MGGFFLKNKTAFFFKTRPDADGSIWFTFLDPKFQLFFRGFGYPDSGGYLIDNDKDITSKSVSTYVFLKV